jgi:hypothetical protein
MPRYTEDAIVPAFRQNFVKVWTDALMNDECGISATHSAVRGLAGPNRPLISGESGPVYPRKATSEPT